MKQFAALDLNNLKPDVKKTMTKTVYFLRESRLKKKKNRIFQAYIDRSGSRGLSAGILNIEELATLWHFPLEASVRASLIQKAQGRKADAPSSLPLESQLTSAPDSLFAKERISDDFFITNENDDKEDDFMFEDTGDDITKKTSSPPENLPFV